MLQFDLAEIIKTVGYVGLFLMVFAESGLFFGFFLPGDSLLFTAGFLASQSILDQRILVVLFALAAIAGDSAGYWTGKEGGKWLMKQKDNFIFKKKYIHKAKSFYQKNGGKTLIIARFIPAVRTFVPIVAGMTQMNYKKFLSFNIIGGILWGSGISTAGYLLGQRIPNADKYLFPITILIVLISITPGILHSRQRYS